MILYTENGYFYLKTDYANRNICKAIPGFYFIKTRKATGEKDLWRYPATPITAYNINRLFKDYQADNYFYEELQAAEAIFNNKELKDKTDLENIPNMKLNAWMHQRQAYHFAKNLNAVMLAMAMGTGKTYVTVALCKNRGFKRILVVCPKSVMPVWEKEFQKHTTGFKTVILDTGTTERKTRSMQQFYKSNFKETPLVTIVNYETVWREPLGDYLLQDANLDFCVLDESHKIKSASGRASKYCEKLSRSVRYKICLTGTPMPHSPLDIYGQFRFLEPGIFGLSFVRFRANYAILGQFKQPLNFVNLEDMNKRFHLITYKAEQNVLDLPEAVDMERFCELEPETRKAYDMLEKELYTQIKAEEITVQNALVKFLRLQQIACGHVKTDDGNIIETGTEKAAVLEEILDDIDKNEKIVVFCKFIADLDLIKTVASKAGRAPVELSGRINNLKQFQDGDADLIAVQIQAGGVGIDLTMARYCIYYSIGFSNGDYLQSRARVHRPGQTRPVTYLHIKAKKTVDEKVYKALEKKGDIVRLIMDEIILDN